MLQDPLIRYPIAISLGAIAGALSRYYLTLWFAQRWGTSFPYGTFFINLTGCLGMGFFMTLASDRLVKIPPEAILMVTTGFLGAYTTFSTYGLDSLILLRFSLSRPESISYAISTVFYWAGSAILGIVGVQIGIVIARWRF